MNRDQYRVTQTNRDESIRIQATIDACRLSDQKGDMDRYKTAQKHRD